MYISLVYSPLCLIAVNKLHVVNIFIWLSFVTLPGHNIQQVRATYEIILYKCIGTSF